MYASVEIVCQEDGFVSLDFGDFAWIIIQEEGAARVCVCSGKEYVGLCYFLEGIDHQMCSHSFEKISKKDFQEAVAISRHYKDSEPRFKRFMKKVFPSYLHFINK